LLHLRGHGDKGQEHRGKDQSTGVHIYLLWVFGDRLTRVVLVAARAAD
jgi:hypothetical protein